MAERLVELIRDLAKGSKDPRVVELLSLVGKDGDPHEIERRSERGDEDIQPQDTDRFAQVDSIDDGDIRYQPGDGYFISTLKLSDKEFRVKPKFKGWRGKEWSGQFLPERMILHMAKEIEAYQKLHAAAEQYRTGLHDRLTKNHPHTDAADAKNDRLHNQSDDFALDRSQSYIYVGTTQGTDQWLNGSAVPHSRCVTVQIGSPDGRELVRIYLTMDQFAAALVSHSHVPCTVVSYWSRGVDSVWLSERVRIPPSLTERMESRLRGRFDEKFKWMKEVIATIKANVEAGKPMGKTAQAEIVNKLETAVGHLMDGTADFTVGQSLEEVSAIVEQAAIHLCQTYGLTKEQIEQSPVVGAIVSRPALPAPKPNAP